MANFILVMPKFWNEIRSIVVRKIETVMKQREVAKLLEMNHKTVYYIWKRSGWRQGKKWKTKDFNIKRPKGTL